MLLSKDMIYTDKIEVNPKKLQEISKVRQYIPQEYQGFYDEILNLSTSIEEANDENGN